MVTRPNDLTAIAVPTANLNMVADGATVGRLTIEQVVSTGRPLASQAEAEAGTQATKAMTPLTTAQAIVAQGGVAFASASQGTKADSAVQPEDLSTVATSGAYADLSGTPELGTAAAEDVGYFGTAAQGALADTALQPDDIGVSVASSAQGVKADTALQSADIGVSVGDMIGGTYDPQAIGGDAFDPKNWGQPVISGRNILSAISSSTTATARYILRSDRDLGLGNALQSFVFDVRNRYIYSGTRTSVDPEYVIINRYNMDGPYDQVSIDYMLKTTELRHQSLAIEYLKAGSIKLWSSSEVSRHLLVRCGYTALGAPNNVEYFQIADDDDPRAWNVDITPSQHLLIAQSTTTVRVYDFQAMLAAGPGDHRGTQLYEWDGIFTSQGFRCDDQYIYIISGTGELAIQDVDLWQYTIDGKLVQHEVDIQTGRADAALEGSGLYNEPENLFIYRKDLLSAPALAMGFAQGDSNDWPGRANKIYIPADSNVKSPYVLRQCDEANAIYAAMTGTLPTLYKSAIAEYIIQAKEKGIWSRYGALWMMAGDTDPHSLVDWIQPGVNNLTKIGTPTWTKWAGYTGNGTTTLLKSTLAITSLSSFTQNDNHFSFVNSAGEAGASMTDMSISPATGSSDYFARIRNASDDVNVRNGALTTQAPALAADAPTGASELTVSRTSSTLVTAYFDGRLRWGGNIAQTSTVAASGFVYLLGRYNGAVVEGSTRTMVEASVGASLTRQQAAIKRNLGVEFRAAVATI